MRTFRGESPILSMLLTSGATLGLLTLIVPAAHASFDWLVRSETLHLGDNAPGNDCDPPPPYGMEWDTTLTKFQVFDGVFIAEVASVADPGASVYLNDILLGEFPISSDPGNCDQYDWVVFPATGIPMTGSDVLRIEAAGPNPEDRDDIWIRNIGFQMDRFSFAVGKDQTIDLRADTFGDDGRPIEIRGADAGHYKFWVADDEGCSRWYSGGPCYGEVAFTFFNVVSYEGNDVGNRDLVQDTFVPGVFGLTDVEFRDNGSLYAYLTDTGNVDNSGQFTVYVEQPVVATLPESPSATAIDWLEIQGNPGSQPRFLLSSPLDEPTGVVLVDVQGRRVAQFRDDSGTGLTSWTWDGRGLDGQRLPSGVYFYLAQSGREYARGNVVLTR